MIAMILWDTVLNSQVSTRVTIVTRPTSIQKYLNVAMRLISIRYREKNLTYLSLQRPESIFN